MNQKVVLDNKECYIYRSSNKSKAVFVHGYHPYNKNDDKLWNKLCENKYDNDCSLISYKVDDWNNDFSPCYAENPLDNEPFYGNGNTTLSWLENSCIKYIEEYFDKDVKIIPIGYSLSGLFALWSLYKTDRFSGAICCSGSLWFDNWIEFIKTNSLSTDRIVYLSLGGKESKSENRTISQIEIRTNETYSILKDNLEKDNVILKINKGGHFADSSNRLFLGIQWMIDKI